MKKKIIIFLAFTTRRIRDKAARVSGA